MNYPAGTVTVAGVTGTIYPDRTFDAANVTVTAGTNVLTAVYHGPAFTNTLMVATDKVTVVVGNAAYTHDGNGNLTGDQNFTYQYDLANRLTNVILKASNVSVLAIRYDGLGRRIQVVRNGTIIERYVYFPGSFLVLAILDGSNAVKEIYTHGPDLSGTVGGAGGIGGILSVTTNINDSAARKYLHADAVGNVILVSDSDGKQLAAYGYTPFGKPVSQVGEYKARFLFSSKEFDAETGLINFGLRLLNTRQGTWLTRDMLGEVDTPNLYSAFRNSPLRRFDPWGLLTSSEAFQHYRSGPDDPNRPDRRIPLRMSFSEIDTSAVTVDRAPKVRELLKDCTPGTYLVKWAAPADNIPFTTSGDQALFLGDISLKLEGTLTIAANGDWKFTGTLKSFDDLYDFNASTHRGLIGEALTWFGREKITGKPFMIEIRGQSQLTDPETAARTRLPQAEGGGTNALFSPTDASDPLGPRLMCPPKGLWLGDRLVRIDKSFPRCAAQ